MRDCEARRRHHRSRGRLPDQTKHAAVRHSHGRLGVRQGPDRRSAHRSACARRYGYSEYSHRPISVRQQGPDRRSAHRSACARRYGAACLSCAGIPCLLSGPDMPTPLQHVAGAVKRESLLHVAGGAFPTAVVVKNTVYTSDVLSGTFQAAGNPCQPARPTGARWTLRAFPRPGGLAVVRRPPGAVRTGAPMPTARTSGCLASVGNNLDDAGTVSALSPNPNAFRHPAHPGPSPAASPTHANAAPPSRLQPPRNHARTPCFAMMYLP
jgi:hypothetical protein